MSKKTKKRRFPWRTALLGVALLIVVLLVAGILAAVWEGYSSRRRWAVLQDELGARGEKLQLVELMPSEIPDEENFYADSHWRELTDLVEVETVTRGGRMVLPQPRLPKGQRQLDRLSHALSDAERQKLTAEFPGLPEPKAGATVPQVVAGLMAGANGADPVDQKRAAEAVLRTLLFADPALSRLTELAERPGAVFSAGDPKNLQQQLVGASGERALYLMTASRLLHARLWAEGVLGDAAAAYRDAVTLLALPDTLAPEPLLISHIVRMALEEVALYAIGDGLRARVWDDAQLADLQTRLAARDFPAALASALRGERGFINQRYDAARKPKPDVSGPRHQPTLLDGLYQTIFGYGNQIHSNRMQQNWIEVIDATPVRGLSAQTFAVFDRDIQAMNASYWQRLRYAVAGLAVPNLAHFAQGAARIQDQITQVQIACALERYRLVHGDYPAELTDLVPEYLAAVPPAIPTLQPMRYQKTPDGGFILSSPGWDRADGGGDDTVWRLSR